MFDFAGEVSATEANNSAGNSVTAIKAHDGSREHQQEEAFLEVNQKCTIRWLGPIQIT